MMNKPGGLFPSPGFQHIIKVRKVKLIVTVSKRHFGLKNVPRASSEPPLKGQALTIPVA